MASLVLVKVLVRILTTLLFSGLLTFVLWHAARYLKLPQKRQTTGVALTIASIVGGFVLITGLVLILIPSLGALAQLKALLVLANMTIFISMIKLFYQCSWKKALQVWGASLIAMIVLGVFVGIVLGIIEQLF